MIEAKSRKWNSATTLYIARRLKEISSGRRIKVLDVGCGAGTIIQHLIGEGYDIYGYDFPNRLKILRKNFEGGILGDFDQHIKIAEDERHIPFEDSFFDVLYANQVFEHVKFIDRMFEECARVIKPEGVLLINFPLATYPIEGHSKIPFAHWIPPGNLRIQYLRMCYTFRVAKKEKSKTALETAKGRDSYLREKTFYRFFNEIMALGGYWFESVEVETSRLIKAKADIMDAYGGKVSRRFGKLFGKSGRVSSFLVTHFVNAAFSLRRPKNNKP